MPVSGLVVTLAAPDASGDAVIASDVVEKIRRHPNFEAGRRLDQRLPVVLDTPDKQTDKRCWGWINELPGVHHVDVAFIHFEDQDAFEASPCSHNAQQTIAAPTIGET